VALDALGSSIRLRVIADSVTRLVAAEAITSFLIGAAAGITQVYRVAFNSFLKNGSKGRGSSEALRSSEFGRRGIYFRRSSRLLIVASAVFKFLEVGCEFEVTTASRRVVKEHSLEFVRNSLF
jgi:hypothetical protein